MDTVAPGKDLPGSTAWKKEWAGRKAMADREAAAMTGKGLAEDFDSFAVPGGKSGWGPKGQLRAGDYK